MVICFIGVVIISLNNQKADEDSMQEPDSVIDASKVKQSEQIDMRMQGILLIVFAARLLRKRTS